MTLSLIRTAPSAMSLVKAIAETRGYSADDLRGRSKLASISRLRRRAYLALEEQKGWSQSQIGRLFRRDRSQVCRGLVLARRERALETITKTDPEYVEELEAQMRRLSGVNLAFQLSHSLDVPVWQAIFLGILMENYPRVRSRSEVCELYDAAAERLGYGNGGEIKDDFVRSFTSRIGRKFASDGLPHPVASISGALVLSDAIAPWLHNRFGKPIAVTSPQRMVG